MCSTSVPEESFHHRTPASKALFLVIVAAALFLLPYFFAVKPAVSLSYVVGYSNRAAVLILLLGTAAFAIFTAGNIARTEARDRRLPSWTLYASLALIAALFFLRRHSDFTHRPLGGGAAFFLDRQQTLATGQVIYRDFDFMYGPLLLYPGLWIAQLFHTSQAIGYFAWLLLQWMLGTVMLWLSVQWLDLSSRFRILLFGLLLANQAPSLLAEGSNYTPFRNNAALFLALVVLAIHKRSASAHKTALAAVVAIALGLACSLEQAIALTLGLAAWFLLLRWQSRELMSSSALALFFIGTAICFGVATYGGMFVSFKLWSAGGLAFPLLPSINNLLVLFPYVVAGCLFLRAFRQRQWTSASILLPLTGAAMLPYALGRCDLGHLDGATPAFVLGIAGILAIPQLRKWWLPLFIVVGYFLAIGINTGNRISRPILATLARHSAVQPPAMPSDIQQGVPQPAPKDDRPISTNDLPCDRTYFSPTLIPSPIDTFRPSCLERGYFRGLVDDVITTEAIQRKVAEMQQHPSEPLLLQNQPLAYIFRPVEDDRTMLRTLEMSLVFPPLRHPPVTFDPILNYIRTHYTPGPVIVRNRLRIWYPMAKPDTLP